MVEILKKAIKKAEDTIEPTSNILGTVLESFGQRKAMAQRGDLHAKTVQDSCPGNAWTNKQLK